jgi:Holliday junction resolvase
MPNSNAQRGVYFERQTRRALEDNGWVVVRAAGSLGPADVVALRNGMTPLLLSCKVSKRIGPGERMALIIAAEAAGARPLLATRVRPGWVDLFTVHLGPEGKHVESLKVPA